MLSCGQKQKQTCLYQNYYSQITNALTEKHTHDNWEKAHEIFKSAFTTVKTPYAKDLEEGLEVSLKLKDEKQTEFIVRKLLSGGIPIEYFNSYASILKSNWWKKIKTDYPKIRKTYHKEYDVALLTKLLALRTQDSLFNVEYHQFRKGEKQVDLKYLQENAKGIYEGFKHLVNSHGFPSEINTGYYYKNKSIQNLPLGVILIHIHQLGERMIEKEFTFEELVCEGHLTEYDYEYFKQTGSIGGGRGTEHEMKAFFDQYTVEN